MKDNGGASSYFSSKYLSMSIYYDTKNLYNNRINLFSTIL